MEGTFNISDIAIVQMANRACDTIERITSGGDTNKLLDHITAVVDRGIGSFFAHIKEIQAQRAAMAQQKAIEQQRAEEEEEDNEPQEFESAEEFGAYIAKTIEESFGEQLRTLPTEVKAMLINSIAKSCGFKVTPTGKPEANAETDNRPGPRLSQEPEAGEGAKD